MNFSGKMKCPFLNSKRYREIKMSLVIRLSLTIVIYDGAVLEKRWHHLMQLLKPMAPKRPPTELHIKIEPFLKLATFWMYRALFSHKYFG